MVIQRLTTRVHRRYGQLLIAGVLTLRHTTLLTPHHWKNYCLGLGNKVQLQKDLVISRLLSAARIKKPIIEAKPTPTKTKTTKLPIALLASFSLFGKKKATPEQPEAAGGKMTETVAKSMAETIQHSDQLFDENNFQEAYDLLLKCTDPESYEIKWRLARVIFNISKTAPSPRKEELVRESFQIAEQALALNDTHFAAHKWYSILLDAKSGLDGLKVRVTQLENVKKHMLKAVELNPGDATSWHILGRFYYGLAELPWYQRKLVSAIFATPPSGSYEEALECFEKAEETKPNFYSMNHLMLGKTYQALNNNEKAKEFLTLAANVVVLNEDDKQAKEDATNLLKKL